MATIVLGAAGMAVGSAMGGAVFGLSAAVIGRAAGATVGRLIDQRLMGSGSDVVETGRVERFRLTGASEGSPVGQVHGRIRVGGQVIWATRFKEAVTVSGGGKGTAPKPTTRSYSYSVSLAIALCEGEISRVGRIWADGVEVARNDLNLRVYTGRDDQMPDPKIEAIEGAGQAPAYRGFAYVVIEDLELGPFGNRVPQFTFEVMRPAPEGLDASDISRAVNAVALVPGTGEYSLATTPVHYALGVGQNQSANVNSPNGQTDFSVSLEALGEELPNCGSVSLVVSWFGDDLRCGTCQVRPKVEQKEFDGVGMPWSVTGIARAQAEELAELDGRKVYGGTPADDAVVEAIQAINTSGKACVFYPFILMEQLAGNGLPDPWGAANEQPALPWRGRITTSLAPGQAASPDGTSAAESEVSAFFGSVSAADFSIIDGAVVYSGPQEWSFRRFILHYAALCAAAGGVDAFCIGSELRGLTQIRGAENSFPTVEALRGLAADVRSLLGPDTKIGYAADWSEYFGYHPQDGSGDVFFHLDPLWADEQIDFIGIDNYMPLADWRDGSEHADAEWGSIHSLDYLKANIEGGEGYDWYYHSPEAEAAQIRTEITDGAHNEPWVFRNKDIRNWWSNYHHDRIAGVRATNSTAWEPGSKPVWFTEIGCAAVDKGANQPNKFLDPKSSESALPRASNGTRDDLIQMQYLRALHEYWTESAHNPVSETYGDRMIDTSRSHVWAWDVRPYPFFPNNVDLWSDGENYARGHWLNGRSTARSLASVVAEICERAGVSAYDVSRLHGYVRGFSVSDVQSARASLQPLMLAYAFEAVERDGILIFLSRDLGQSLEVPGELVAISDELSGRIESERATEVETAGRVRVNFVDADGDYEARNAEAVFPDEEARTVSQSEMPLALTKAEARGIAERWLAEARIGRDTVRLALPLSHAGFGAGDVVALNDDGVSGEFRLDQVELGPYQIVQGTRIEPNVYQPSDAVDEVAALKPFAAAVPVMPVFMDLPLLTGDEVPHAPHLAVAAQPWPGSVAVYSAPTDAGFALKTIVTAASVVGVTETVMPRARSGIWDRGPTLRVKLTSGSLSSASMADLLQGANAAAIGDGSSDNWEVFQFADVQMMAPDTYELSMRLRGQRGSDAIIPDVWPVGSLFVLLDGTPAQIDLPSTSRDIARHYRIGPAHRPVDDPAYVERIEAFKGIGLRPYAPVHLRAEESAGDLVVSWTRRTRLDGDPWGAIDVPLSEASERYSVRVVGSEGLVRESVVGATGWIYSAAQRMTDNLSGDFRIEVAQVSERFGPGLYRALPLTA